MKRLIASILVFSVVFFCIPRKTQAEIWGSNQAATLVKQALEQAYKTFMDAMLANLKKQAAKLISDRVNALMTGRKASRPEFISNYEDFIYGSAEKVAKRYVKSLFRSATGSASSYTKTVLKRAEGAVVNEMQAGIDDAVSTMDMYVREGARGIFDTVNGGGDSAVMATVVNPYNNVWGAYDAATELVVGEVERVVKIAQTEAISGGGFLGTIDPTTNLIKMPGIIKKEILSYSSTIDMRMTVAAQSVGEVVGQMAAQMVSQSIQSGIDGITEPIDSELIQVNRSVRKAVNDVQSDIYKGIKFTD